jgi:hypothetical protein
MTSWSITTARNILHSRKRLNANKRMDENIVGSSAYIYFEICLMRRMTLTQHFMGGTIMRTFLNGRRRCLGIIFSI